MAESPLGSDTDRCSVAAEPLGSLGATMCKGLAFRDSTVSATVAKLSSTYCAQVPTVIGGSVPSLP